MEKEKLRMAFRQTKGLALDFPLDDRFVPGLDQIPVKSLSVRPHIVLVKDATAVAWDALTDEARSTWLTQAEQDQQEEHAKGRKGHVWGGGQTPSAEEYHQ